MCRRDIFRIKQPLLSFNRPRRVWTNDSVISQDGTESQFDLCTLPDESRPMTDEITEVSNVLRREPNTRDVTDTREIGEEFCVSPIGLIGRLLHSRDVAGVSEFDVPFVLSDKFFGEVGDACACFDGGVNI